MEKHLIQPHVALNPKHKIIKNGDARLTQKQKWCPLTSVLKGCDTDPLKQVLGLLVDPAWIVGGVHADGLKQFILVISMKRRLTDQHFVQQHPKRPPVHRE